MHTCFALTRFALARTGYFRSILAGALTLSVGAPLWAQTAPAPVSRPAATTPASATARAGAAVAEVNGEKIMRADLERMVDLVKAAQPALGADSAEARQALAKVRSDVLEEMIVTRLLVQEARKRRIVAPQSALDASVADLKRDFRSDAEFAQWLARDGKTEADLRRIFSDELVIRELSTQLYADVTLSDDEVRAYYRANLDQFTIPESVTARHILLALNPSAPAAEKERVRARARQLMGTLSTREAFEAAAKANSDDRSNRERGGALGTFPRGVMVKAFEDAAFSAPVGRVAGPVETEHGVHLIWVEARTPARTLTVEQVEKDPSLRALLLRQKVQKRLDEQVEALRANATISRAL